MKWLLINCLIVFGLLLGSTSCRTEYAVVEIETVDANNQPIPMYVYSADNGQFIGNTPSLLYTIFRTHSSNDYLLSLIAKSNDYCDKSQMIKVTKWAKTPVLAHDAMYLNSAQIFVEKKNNCK